MKIRLKENRESNLITLQSVIDVNIGLNSIIKESYRNLYGKKPRQKVNELQVYVGNFKNGSLIQEIALELDQSSANVAQAAFVFGSYKLDDVFTVAKNAIEFWKVFAENKKDGKNITVKIEENSIGIINIGNGNITVGDITFDTAKHILNSGQTLTKPLRNGELENIELGSHNSLVLGFNDSDCFSTPIEIAEETKVVFGNVIEFNKDRKTGTIVYIEDLRKFHLKFRLADESNVIETIDSMKKMQCRMVCHEEYVLGPNGERNVISLLAIKIGKGKDDK